MGELFVDSSVWYALVVRSHPDHERLRGALRERILARVRIMTTSLVVAETHALLLRRAGIAAALAFVRRVRLPPNVIVESTSPLENVAVDAWLSRFDDQPFSLTDAVSFSVMAERGISEALALDHHFSVAGFTRVDR